MKTTLLIKSVGYNDSVSYDIETNKDATDITIRYSPLTDCWSSHVRGKRAMRLTGGDGFVTIERKAGPIKITFDEIERLQLLLSLYADANQPAQLFALKEVSL